MSPKDPKDDLMFFPRLRRNMSIWFLVIAAVIVIAFIIAAVAK